MGVVSTLIGGAMGFGVQLYSNTLQKIPLSRRPWIHASLVMVGCYVGAKYPKWERTLVQEVNEIKAAQGLPPLVGHSSWIRYKEQE